MSISGKTISREARRLGASRKEAIRHVFLEGVKNPADLKNLQSLREASEETGISIPTLYYHAMSKWIRSVKLRVGLDDMIFIPEQEVRRLKAEAKQLTEMASHKEYLTPLEAARELGMNRVHLYQYLLDGRIKSVRRGLGFSRKQWFISRIALKEFKKKRDVRGLILLQKAARILGKTILQVGRIVQEEKLKVATPGLRRGRYVSPETFEAIKAAIKREEERFKKLIPIREAAKKLGVTRQALYTHFSNGHLKGLLEKHGGKPRVFISPESLEEFVRRTRKDGRNHLVFTKIPGAVSVREASRIVGCSQNELYGFIHRGKLVPERVPGFPGSRGWIVIQKEKLDEFLKEYSKKTRKRRCSCGRSTYGAFRKGWKFCPFCGKGLEGKGNADTPTTSVSRRTRR